MVEVVDAIDRQIRIERAPERVVSLVPSETVSVADLVGVERLVGRTDYCIEPLGAVESIASVGGTKGFDTGAVEALRPDLVLANKEENSRPLVQAMIDAGLTVHVSFPCTVDQSLSYLETLCALLHIDAEQNDAMRACRLATNASFEGGEVEPLPVFVPIWKDPWMTFDGGAYASDVLERCGAYNVFSGRPRRYPLAADLGRAEAWGDEKVDTRDTRYPRIRLEEVIERGARAVLLPDEPYTFTDEDLEALTAIDSAGTLRIERVDGKDLFWYGTRVATAFASLGERIRRLRAQSFGI